MFIDEVKVHAKAGRGGDGVTSFFRQPYEPKGPPDGGDGGTGGSVVVRASEDLASLVDYHHRPHRAATRGRHGSGDRRKGADGQDEVLLVPVGTVVSDAEGVPFADLADPGEEVVVARGGRGGRGNAAFRTPRRRSPRFHELGEPGEERWLVLELKLAADVALVGFPNVGKSSLISRISAARPKIADYPFTTLSPALGVVRHDDVDLVVADVPGLIEGAAEGRGLGHAFLRHVERAKVLVHVLDCASHDQRDPREDLEVVVGELSRYAADLLERPAIVLLNKVDADRDVAEIVRPDLEDAGWEVIVGSAVTGEGIAALVGRLAELVARLRAEEPRAVAEPATTRPVLRPRAEEGFVVDRAEDGFRVRGPQVRRWVAMTDFANDEAVAYLAGRLARAGVERALVAAGAREGDTVDLEGVAFDFAPELADLPPEERAAIDEALGDEAPGDATSGAEGGRGAQTGSGAETGSGPETGKGAEGGSGSERGS